MSRMKQSTAEKIAEDVIAGIRSGKLKPGQRVREQELATRFKTSRGPVREALRILDSTFWVTLEPGKGARVVQLDHDSYPDAGVIRAGARRRRRALRRRCGATREKSRHGDRAPRTRSGASGAHGDQPRRVLAAQLAAGRLHHQGRAQHAAGGDDRLVPEGRPCPACQ